MGIHPSSTVYPRVCGGSRTSLTSTLARAGLSPRVRGIRWRWRWLGASARSIPACAGDPAARLPRPRCGAVYPRVCGGSTYAPSSLGNACGLSPRVRGIPLRVIEQKVLVGSIPACAGDPAPYPICPSQATVYPRVCGGSTMRPMMPAWSSGLSPRVRGIQFLLALDGLGRRSIPACARDPLRARRL